MLVHFVTDTPNKAPAIRAMLEPEHAVQFHVLGGGDLTLSNGVLVVDADLRNATPVAQLKTVLHNLQSVTEKLFVVQSHLRDVIAQAFALGATAVVSRPKEIVAKLAQVELAQKRSKPDIAGPSREVADSAATFSSVFSAAGMGKLITLSDAEKATRDVIDGIKRNGLNAWLDDVRRYHEGTFQHCLLVTGIAVAFGMSIKFPEADVMRLGLAATLHDVGKARIPLAILDKPGRLDEAELAIMKSSSGDRLRTIARDPRDRPRNTRWGPTPPRIPRRLRLSGRTDGAGDFRPRAPVDDFRYLRCADRVEAIQAIDVAAGCLQDPVRHGWQAGKAAGEGVRQRGVERMSTRW